MSRKFESIATDLLQEIRGYPRKFLRKQFTKSCTSAALRNGTFSAELLQNDLIQWFLTSFLYHLFNIASTILTSIMGHSAVWLNNTFSIDNTSALPKRHISLRNLLWDSQNVAVLPILFAVYLEAVLKLSISIPIYQREMSTLMFLPMMWNSAAKTTKATLAWRYSSCNKTAHLFTEIASKHRQERKNMLETRFDRNFW